jgi:uncharacterized protein (DUF1697 family)
MSTSPRIVLLRGINIGAKNRIAMPALREALTAAGHGNVRTYLQSGNIVLESELADAELEAAIGELIREQFGLSIAVLARSVAELRQVVDANPFAEIAERNPKRFQVTFLSSVPGAEAVAELEAFAAEQGEPFAAVGRALYACHPEGIHVSKVATRMTPKRLGVEQASARNWATVTTLLEMETS